MLFSKNKKGIKFLPLRGRTAATSEVEWLFDGVKYFDGTVWLRKRGFCLAFLPASRQSLDL